jgi:hypothetical protein
MRGIALITVGLSACLLVPAYAADDKAKEWCTDAHMQKMDGMIAKMTDAAKKKDAELQFSLSKTAMQGGDMPGCVEHMKEAHKAMGL